MKLFRREASLVILVALGLKVLAISAHQQEDPMVQSGVVTTPGDGLNPYSPHASHRNAQEEPNYVAEYVGRFQYERTPVCRGEFPQVRATCRGTVEVQRVSNDRFISCGAVEQNEDETTSITCVTTCSPSQCVDVFLSLDRENLVDGPYGEVYFRCSGDTILDAEGSFTYLETGNGDCATSALPTRNFHIAQMGMLNNNMLIVLTDISFRIGVLCGDEYSFAGYFFECLLFIDTIRTSNGTQVYTCVNGENCQGSECIVVFDDIVIEAHVENFQESCVSSPNGLALSSSPTPPPQERRRKLVAEFNFLFGADSGGSSDPTCGIDRPTVTVRCTNGEIAFVESTLGLNPCDRVDEQTLVCEGGGGMQLVGGSDSVTYVRCVNQYVQQRQAHTICRSVHLQIPR